MRNLRMFYGLTLLIAMVSCKSQLSSTERAARDQQLNNLAQQMENGNGAYHIIMNTAFPLSTNSLNGVLNGVLLGSGDSASRIDLRDRTDFIILGIENVQADLSYYGERRISSGYGNQDTGILYNNAPRDYSQQIDYEKGMINIYYRVSHQTESYDVDIEVFSSQNANINISSSHRSSIRYTGKLEWIEDLDIKNSQ